MLGRIWKSRSFNKLGGPRSSEGTILGLEHLEERRLLSASAAVIGDATVLDSPAFLESAENSPQTANASTQANALDSAVASLNLEQLLEQVTAQRSDSGPVVVSGSDGHDRIRVSQGSVRGTAVIDIEVFANTNMDEAELVGRLGFTVDSTSGLIIQAGDGNDQLTVDSAITDNITVRGGAGDDVVELLGFARSGQNSDRLIYGDDGNDTLRTEINEQGQLIDLHTYRFDGGAGVNTIDVQGDRNFALSESALQISTVANNTKPGDLVEATVGLANVSRAEIEGGQSGNTLTVDYENGATFEDGIVFDGVDHLEPRRAYSSSLSEAANSSIQQEGLGLQNGFAALTLDSDRGELSYSLELAGLDLFGSKDSLKNEAIRDALVKQRASKGQPLADLDQDGNRRPDSELTYHELKIRRLNDSIQAAVADDVSSISVVDAGGNELFNLATFGTRGRFLSTDHQAVEDYELDRSASSLTGRWQLDQLPSEFQELLENGELSFKVSFGAGRSIVGQIKALPVTDANPDKLVIQGTSADSVDYRFDHDNRNEVESGFSDGRHSEIEFHNIERVDDGLVARSRAFFDSHTAGSTDQPLVLGDDVNLFNGISRVTHDAVTIDFVNPTKSLGITTEGENNVELRPFDRLLSAEVNVTGDEFTDVLLATPMRSVGPDVTINGTTYNQYQAGPVPINVTSSSDQTFRVQFDFNHIPTFGGVSAVSPTQLGFQGVLPTDSRANGLSYGWFGKVGSADRGPLHPTINQHHRDFHFGRSGPNGAAVFEWEVPVDGAFEISFAGGDLLAARTLQLEAFGRFETLIYSIGDFRQHSALEGVVVDGIARVTVSEPTWATNHILWTISGGLGSTECTPISSC